MKKILPFFLVVFLFLVLSSNSAKAQLGVFMGGNISDVRHDKLLLNEINLMKSKLEKRNSNYIIRNFLNIITEKKLGLIDKENLLNKSLKYKVINGRDKLSVIKKMLSKINLEEKIRESIDDLSNKEKYLIKIMSEKLQRYKNDLDYKNAVISKYNSGDILKQGYTLTKHKGKLVTKKENLKKNDEITTVFSDGEVKSIIEQV